MEIPRQMINPLSVPDEWDVLEDRRYFPPLTKVLVGGEVVPYVTGYSVPAGLVRALCSGQKQGHPSEKHLDPDVADRVCAVVLRGTVSFQFPEGASQFLAAPAALFDEVREMLEALEWSAAPLLNTGPRCPACREPKEKGHADGCRIASLLARLPKGRS